MKFDVILSITQNIIYSTLLVCVMIFIQSDARADDVGKSIHQLRSSYILYHVGLLFIKSISLYNKETTCRCIQWPYIQFICTVQCAPEARTLSAVKRSNKRWSASPTKEKVVSVQLQ